MLDHIRQRQELIAKSITSSYVNTDSIIKGGPGSGRTVGSTKSGKVLTTKDFSQEGSSSCDDVSVPSR